MRLFLCYCLSAEKVLIVLWTTHCVIFDSENEFGVSEDSGAF